MHHLGHILLAEGPPPFQFGAFIADGVRRQAFEKLPSEIQLGVRFHRWVDWQTDRHPAFLAARRVLRPVAGRYAGLIADLWLDAVLGALWPELNLAESLEAFAERFLKETLRPHLAWIPPSWCEFAAALQRQNLLQQFGDFLGMAAHIERFIERRRLPIDSTVVRSHLEVQQEPLLALLSAFWREAIRWQTRAETFAQKL